MDEHWTEEKAVLSRLRKEAGLRGRYAGLRDVDRPQITLPVVKVLLSSLGDIEHPLTKDTIFVLLGSRTPPKLLRACDAFGTLLREFWSLSRTPGTDVAVKSAAIALSKAAAGTEEDVFAVREVVRFRPELYVIFRRLLAP